MSKINIDDLTLGQIKQLTSFLPQTSGVISEVLQLPVNVGQAYLFRGVTNYNLGRVVEVVGQYVILEDASWVADIGRFSEALKTGKLKEVEPYPSEMSVNVAACVDFCPWDHELPTKAK